MSNAKTNNDPLVTAIYDAFMSDQGGSVKANLIDSLEWIRTDLPELVDRMPNPSESIEKAGLALQ